MSAQITKCLYSPSEEASEEAGEEASKETNEEAIIIMKEQPRNIL